MADADSMLAGFTAGTFAIVGLIVLGCCLRKTRQPYVSQMKASPSMEELTQIDNDPQVVQQQV